MIKQLLATYQSLINTNQLTQARLSMMTANINRGENQPAFDDISIFLPFPARFMQDNTELLIQVPKSVAREFLDSYEKMAPEVEVAFTAWIPSLKSTLLS